MLGSVSEAQDIVQEALTSIPMSMCSPMPGATCRGST
jgi:hypothetical protein